MGVFAKDLTNQRFGKLVVLEFTGKVTAKGHNAIWLCKCDCGNVIEVRGTNLTTKRRPQKSCGCIKKELATLFSAKHGGYKERLYGVWIGMKRRCESEKSRDFHRYGGRGICICEEWQDYAVFREWALRNGYDPDAKFQKCTLDRIDTNGNYEPRNCRWVDIKTQENNKRSNKLIEYGGKTQSIKMWSEELGINAGLIYDRLRNGWGFERAISEPVHKYTKKV